MKTPLPLSRLSLVVAAVLLGLPGAASAARYPQPVTDAIERALDDEYQAEALYSVAIAAFGEQRPFTNIIRAERRHQEMLKDLLRASGTPIPANGWLDGTKPRPEVPATRQAACAAGVAAEVANADLYDKDLLPKVVDYPEVTRVFTALRDASQQRHLPALRRCAR